MILNDTNVGEVRLWGQTVGAVAWDEQEGIARFEYAPEFLASGYELSPIHHKLSSQIYSGSLNNYETFKGLPSFLADILPDDFGNKVINGWLASKGQDKESFTPLHRLLYTGTRGMGALEFFPAINKEAVSDNIQLDQLVDLANKILANREDFYADLADDDAMNTILQVGTSAGGARPKAVIAWNRETNEIRSGQAESQKGFEHWLLKFDGVGENDDLHSSLGEPQGYGTVEYAYYKLATACGITMMECDLLEDGDRRHFVTRRFDRSPEGEKLHILTLCGMDYADYKQPGGYSYEETFSLMRKLGLPYDDAVQLYRRMIFNIVARIHDDHTKNFSFLMNQHGEWRLSPAYDVAWSYKKGNKWVDRHNMTLAGKRDHFTRSDIINLGKTIRGLDADGELDHIISVVSGWAEVASQCGVDANFTETIAQSHRLEISDY